MRLTIAIVLLALITPVARAQPFDSLTLAQGRQPAASDTLTVRGVVVTANDAPLPRARVAIAVGVPAEPAILGRFPDVQRGVLTDDRGQFTIQVPATPSMRLAFTKARYTTQTADLLPRVLTARSSDIRVRMSLASAISGRVIDRSGTGVMAALVTLKRVGGVAADTPTLAMTNADDRAAPVRDYTVVVFSPFRDRWSALSRWVKTTHDWPADGTFIVKGLPPGDYWVAAIERRNSTFEPTADPELLESLSTRAVRISLGEGQSQDLTLRLIRR